MLLGIWCSLWREVSELVSWWVRIAGCEDLGKTDGSTSVPLFWVFVVVILVERG